MELDTANWERALARVRRSLLRAAAALDQDDQEQYEEFRSSTIQHFEVAWELSVKFLQRGLRMYRSHQEVDDLSYRNLVRVGAECSLIEDPAAWYDFREMRNRTSHTYSEATAQEVFDMVPEFLRQADYLYARIASKED